MTPVFDNSCGLLLHSHGVSPIQNESRRVSFTAFRLVLPPRAHALIRLRQERDADRNERLIDSLDIGAARRLVRRKAQTDRPLFLALFAKLLIASGAFELVVSQFEFIGP